MSTASPRVGAFEAALAESRQSWASGDAVGAFASLGRAHVLGQRDFGPHLKVHLRMLRIVVAVSDWREVRGQLLRIAHVPLGHLLARLPRGNTGSAAVAAFAPTAVPPDIERVLDNREL